MQSQAAVGRRTRSKSKQTTLHEYECSTSSAAANDTTKASGQSKNEIVAGTPKLTVEKSHRDANLPLPVEEPKPEPVKYYADDATLKALRGQVVHNSNGRVTTSIVASSDGTPHHFQMTQPSASHANPKRGTAYSKMIEATKPSKRQKAESHYINFSNDSNNKVNLANNKLDSGDVAHDNNRNTARKRYSNNQDSVEIEATPVAKVTHLRAVTIEPKPQQNRDNSLQVSTPHFHTAWKTPHTSISASLPPGVIDIDTFHHQCCNNSLISHRGYSWLTSQRRCHCNIDANHNSSESFSQAYMAAYGQERYTNLLKNEWKLEKWTHRRVYSERNAQVDRMLNGLEERWEEDNLPPMLLPRLEDHLDYMYRQRDIDLDVRRVVMDWLVEVIEEYRMSSETLYLSAMLFDRTLAMSYGVEGYPGGEMIMKRGEMQCMICACIFIAAKLFEVTPPNLDEIVYITMNSYSRQDILDMESRIVKHLGFNLHFVTPYDFMRRFLAASQASSPCSVSADRPAMMLGRNNANNDMVESFVSYLLHLALLEYKFVTMKPSRVAAAAVYLARCTFGIREPTTFAMTSSSLNDEFASPSFQPAANGYWSKTLQYYTGYDMWALEKPVKLLHRLLEVAENEEKLRSAFKKHEKGKHNYVALKVVVSREDLGFS